MAGTQERPINQPLSGEAKSRIGSFHLRQLLEADLVAFDVGHFKDINDDTFSEFFSIPPSLMEELKLDKLNWQAIRGANNPMYNQLPVVIKGAEKNHALEKDADINNAMATIEIARRVNLQTGHYIPILVRIAGVARNNRIVAATYDLTEPENPLTHLNISLSNPELKSLNTNRWNISPHITIPLPSNLIAPYKTAGLITAGMRDKIRAEDPQQPLHEKALSIQTNKKGVYFAIGGLNLDAIGLIIQTVKGLGYYAKRINGMVTVGLTVETAKERGIESWEISMPATLQKA